MACKHDAYQHNRETLSSHLLLTPSLSEHIGLRIPTSWSNIVLQYQQISINNGIFDSKWPTVRYVFLKHTLNPWKEPWSCMVPRESKCTRRTRSERTHEISLQSTIHTHHNFHRTLLIRKKATYRQDSANQISNVQMILLRVLILITSQTGTRILSSVAARNHGREADLALWFRSWEAEDGGKNGSVMFHNREEAVGLADGTADLSYCASTAAAWWSAKPWSCLLVNAIQGLRMSLLGVLQ